MRWALPRIPWAMALIALALSVIGPGLAQSQQSDGETTVEISDFVGEWQGMGILETEDSLFFAMNRRDLDVIISGSEREFTVEWTTITRSGTNPDDPEIRRNSSSLTFRPADHPNVFEARSSGSPLNGDVMSWARLNGQTLSVYQMSITEGGGYSVATYDRTLTDDAMQLRFVRLQDGQPTREVNGQLSQVEQ
ncbi:MAG: hypothetical protein AAF414_24310 [Pseudomonadota bacterium]